MTTRHVTEATMRVRDVLYEGLLRRRDEVLTEEVARERANNLATAVVEALHQLAEESKPPPVREAPPSRYHFDAQCPLNAWCCDSPGHAGDCLMPF